MPLQIDEVTAELVAPPKPENVAKSRGSKAELDLRGQFELLLQRQKRLRAD
jgi:hypothetical protein